MNEGQDKDPEESEDSSQENESQHGYGPAPQDDSKLDDVQAETQSEDSDVGENSEANDKFFDDIFDEGGHDEEEPVFNDDSYWDFDRLSGEGTLQNENDDWSLGTPPENADQDVLRKILSEPGLWVVPDLHDKERELLLNWLANQPLTGIDKQENVYCAHPVEGVKTSEVVLLSQMVSWHSDHLTALSHTCYVVDPRDHTLFFSSTEVKSFISEIEKVGISVLLMSRGATHTNLKRPGAKLWRPDFYSFWWRSFTETFFAEESNDAIQDQFKRAKGLLDNGRTSLLGTSPTRAKLLRLRKMILETPDILDREGELGDVIQQVMDAFLSKPTADGSRLREAHNKVFRISSDLIGEQRNKRENGALQEPEATALFVAWNCLQNNDGKPIQLMDFKEIFNIQLQNMSDQQQKQLAESNLVGAGKKEKKGKKKLEFDAQYYLKHNLFSSRGDMLLEYIGLDVVSSTVKGKQLSFRHPDLLDHLGGIFNRRRANYASAQINRFFMNDKIWLGEQEGVLSYANKLMVLKFRQYGPIIEPNIAKRCVDEILKDFDLERGARVPNASISKRYSRVVVFIMYWFDEQQKLSPDSVEETAKAFSDFVTLLSKQLMEQHAWLDFVFLFKHMVRQRPELLNVTAIFRMINERAPFETKWDVLNIVERDARKQTGNDFQYRIFRYLVADINKPEDVDNRYEFVRDAFLAGLALRVIPTAVQRLKSRDYKDGAEKFSDTMVEKIFSQENGIGDLTSVMTSNRVWESMARFLGHGHKSRAFDKFAFQETIRIEEMCFSMKIKPLEGTKNTKSNPKSHDDFHEELYRAHMKTVQNITTLVENLPSFSRFNTPNFIRRGRNAARIRKSQKSNNKVQLFIPILQAHFESSTELESINSLNLLVFVELHGALMSAGRIALADKLTAALADARKTSHGLEEKSDVKKRFLEYGVRIKAAKLGQKRGLVTLVKNAREELKMGKISQEDCQEFEAFLRRRHEFVDFFTLAGSVVKGD